MKKLLPWFTAGFGCLVAFGVAPGCGSSELAGDAAGAGGNGAGIGGGRFVPGSATGGRGNTGGNGAVTGGNTATGGRVNATTTVGARCANDAACGAGLQCFTSSSTDLGGGGPPGGLCTLACTSANPGVCQQFGTTLACITMDNQGNGFCLETCTPGSPATQAESLNKCHGRAEMACSAATDSTGAVVGYFCAPQCNGGVGECLNGTSCSFESAIASFGLCKATPAAGLPTGSPCNPKAATNPCRGLCLPLTSPAANSATAGVCGDGCSVGAGDSCNPGGGGKLEAVCLPVFPGDGRQDAGLCTRLCSCSADCIHPNMKCYGFGDAALQAQLGQKGLCAYPSANDTPADTASIIESCAGSGAGGAGGAGGVGSGGAAATGGMSSAGAPATGGVNAGGGGAGN